MHWIVLGGALVRAHAAEGFGSGAVSASLVPGVRAGPATAPTLGGYVAFDGVSTPTMRFGVSATGGVSFGESDRISARWGVWREQRLCDDCDVGPVGVGPDLLGSTDLDLTGTHVFALDGGGQIWALALVTLPASRDAFACNPLIGAPGAGFAFRMPAGGALLGVGVTARRPIYAFGAAPAGRCDVGEAPVVRTAAGTSLPRPWSGERWGAANPVLSASGSVQAFELEDLFGGVDRHLTTAAAVSVLVSRDGRADDATVWTLGGAADVRRANEPARVAFPWTVSAGVAFTPASALSLSLSNVVPAVMADPGGTLRALPASTQAGLTLSVQPPELR